MIFSGNRRTQVREKENKMSIEKQIEVIDTICKHSSIPIDELEELKDASTEALKLLVVNPQESMSVRIKRLKRAKGEAGRIAVRMEMEHIIDVASAVHAHGGQASSTRHHYISLLSSLSETII